MMKRLQILIICILLVAIIKAENNLSREYLRYVTESDSLCKLSQYLPAEESLMKAIHEEPGNPMNVLLMSNIGILRHYMGSDSTALEILNKAASIAPSSVTVRSNKAKVLVSLNKLHDAEQEYSEIARLDSNIVEPIYMQTIINLKIGKLQKADTLSDKIYNKFPENLQAQEARAYYLVASGKFQEAIPLLNKIVKAEPISANYSQRAYCNLMLGNLNEASSDISSALATDSMNPELYAYRAILNKMRYRPEDSKKDVERAIQFGASESYLKHLELL